MKNLAKLIGGIGLIGSLGLGGCGEEESKHSPYSEISLNYYVEGTLIKKFSAQAKRNKESCVWASIIYENTDDDGIYDKIQSYVQIDSSKARYQQIKFNRGNGTINYDLSILFRSLENCVWGEVAENKIHIKNGHKTDFDRGLRTRIESTIARHQTSCNDDWRWFLKDELKKKGFSEDLISSYQIIYSDINEERIFQNVWAYAKDNQGEILCGIGYEDSNRDKLQDRIQLLTKIKFSKEYKKEVLEIDYEKEKTRYFGDSEGLTVNERIKQISSVKLTCRANSLIPFLYEEYDFWTDDSLR